jgi:predicted small secreted protein
MSEIICGTGFLQTELSRHTIIGGKMKKIILVCCILVISCIAASAQNARKQAQANLIRAFIQKKVTVKVDLPSTDKGFEIHADKQNSADAEKNLKRLKGFGASIQSGGTAMVTDIRVAKDEISFELNGGGLPESTLAGRGIGPVPTRASTTGTTATPRINRDSNSSPRDTEHEQSRAKYESAEREHNEARTMVANEAMRQGAIDRLRAAGLQMGSRFVIKFDGRDTASVTPDELKRLLADYVVF